MRFIVFTLFFLFASVCLAQENYTSFTLQEGLPSNNVYRCVEDNSGFLWVATDAGIARFDGKRFQIFTTRHGLPDNDVLDVIKEKNGQIWVNCFKQRPAYFDEVRNRFINSNEDGILAKIPEGTGLMDASPLKNGGILYWNEIGSFILKDKKLTSYPHSSSSGLVIRENSDGTQLKYIQFFDPILNLLRLKIYQAKGSLMVDSINIGKFALGSSESVLYTVVDDEKLYQFHSVKKICYIYSNLNTNPIRFKKDSIQVPEPFTVNGVNASYVFLLGNSGKMYVFDKKSLKQEMILGGNYLPNSVFKDRKGNLWVSTFDKGLILYRKSLIKAVKMPQEFKNTIFLSIARKPNGNLLAGNSFGDVVESNLQKSEVHPSRAVKKEYRLRKILISQNNVFTFSEGGIFVNYRKFLTNPPRNRFYPAKTAISYNDSIIFFGLMSGLQKLNTKTGKVEYRPSVSKRVTAIAKASEEIIYFGSTDGLYKYDYIKQVSLPRTANDSLLNQRITALCTTSDKLLLVATARNGLVLVKKDKVILNLTEKEGIISNSLISIATAGGGRIWLGTGQGISVVSYSLNGPKVRYSVQNLSVNDGLTSNSINEMLYHQGIIYAATGNGISMIPAAISIPRFNIPVKLIRLSVNQRDTILASSYKLGYKQQNIQMQFAGIELSGHFKNLQYTLDKNKNWISLDENALILQLNSGSHIVQIRAVDVNGNISNKILSIRFDIETPFWKSIWFWSGIALAMQVLIIYLVNRRQKRRKEAKLAKKIAEVQIASLEQQAFTSLMNPHFMFNALNSVQHYINVQDRQNANRYLSDFASLIRQNFEAAQQSFIPLEQEIENIKIYLRLEKMRFKDRFSYQISVDEDLDTDDWMIPTMILQPLLENALLHGIMPSDINGEVLITLDQQDGDLLITITDNGIGIVNSLALKEDSKHKSMGMELIKKRIRALSRFGPPAITIEMSPAYGSEKNPGNKIILFIPAQLHQAWLKAQHQ